MVKEITTIEAIKIYFSKTTGKEGKPYTFFVLLIFSLLFFLVIPMIIILCPYEIYKIKKEGGIKKSKRKYYLYYNKK